MRILSGFVGSSVLALMAGSAFAQVTNVGTNRSEVQDNGRDNKALVENGAQGNDRNSSLIIFSGNGNRATVEQVGYDNLSRSEHQGDLNTSFVRQRGYRNSVTLLQVGNGNGSSIDQYLDPGVGLYPDRVANVEQRGNANSSSIVQVSGTSTATVRQGTATEASNGGVSTIYQFSTGNVATVTMVGGSPDAANRSHIEQTRIDPIFTANSATVNIGGSFNLSYLYQVGARNVSVHSMTGTQNTIIDKSYGDSDSSSIIQDGYRNFATVNQYAGNRNSSRIEQRDQFGGGGDRQVYVSQGGSDNSSTVIQRYTSNNAVVNQSGLGTISSIAQMGIGNFARANLLNGSLEARNKSSIAQNFDQENLDTRLIADVSIRGSANESNISQTGLHHAASVDMAGGGVGNDAAGRRNGNSVNIEQNRIITHFTSPPNNVGDAGHTARVQVGLLSGGGVGTVTSIYQSGRHENIGNVATVRQDGQYDSVSIFQATRFSRVDGGAVANVSARGFLNQVSLTQYGREFATVTQGFGRDSRLSATQYDSAGSRFAEAFYAGGRGSNSIVASQYGDRNSVDAVQEGTDNAITVWQKVGSSDNSISINQGQNRFQISDEPCGLRCQFTYNAVASVIQSGRFNSGSVIQYYGGFSTALGPKATIQQNGTGSSALPNVARISQFETGGEASILQTESVGPSQAGDPASGAPGDPNYFAGGGRSAEARIRQTSDGISARIEQRGRGQYAFIDQRGANTASILQDTGATNATAIITQTGSGNSYNVVQTQPGQYINISQTGANNSITNVISRP